MKRGIGIFGGIVFVLVGVCSYFFLYRNKHTIETVDVPEFSHNILVGFYYGGSSWGTYEETVTAFVTIYKDGTITAKIQEDPIEVSTIPKENMDILIEKLNLSKLYLLDPETSEVTDVGPDYIYIYDTDDKVLKLVGGTMPQNKEFISMYEAIFNNIPKEWIQGVIDEHIARYLESVK